MCERASEGGGGSRMMPSLLVSALQRMEFHYLGKAEGKASLDRSRNSVFRVTFKIT